MRALAKAILVGGGAICLLLWGIFSLGSVVAGVVGLPPTLRAGPAPMLLPCGGGGKHRL